MFQLKMAVVVALAVSCGVSAQEPFRYTSEAECTSVRLDLPPAPTAALPIVNQGGTFFCAAYATTQLIESWLVSKKPAESRMISPISLAIEFASRSNSKNLLGFSAADLLIAASNLRPCTRKIIDDDRFQPIFLHHLWLQYKAAQGDTSPAADAVIKSVEDLGFRGVLRRHEVVAFFNESSPVKFQHRVLNAICNGSNVSLSDIPPIKSIIARSHQHHSSAMLAFNEAIKDRLAGPSPQPVAVAFCPDVAIDRKAKGLFSGESKLVNDSNCKSQAHFAPIFGRRLAHYQNKAGQKKHICQYLVRDSAGPTCDGYPADAETTPSIRCERGQWWIDEDSLLRNTSEIHYLDIPKT